MTKMMFLVIVIKARSVLHMSAIPFLLDEEAYRLGFRHWVGIDYGAGSPHTVFAGRSGSGKTIAAKSLIARTILYAEPKLQPVEVYIIDPKSDTDFDFLVGLPRFFRGEQSVQGLETVFDRFRQRQEQGGQGNTDNTRNLIIAFIDEFASLVNFVEDKKEKEKIFQKLSLLLMLSRSFSFSIQLATQQPSAQTLGNSGNREQLGIVCLLGDSGSETQRMLFDSDSIERMKDFGHIGGRGVGWLSINGGFAQPVRVPKITNFDKLHAVIRKGVEREGK
jgi:hypothetical protein